MELTTEQLADLIAEGVASVIEQLALPEELTEEIHLDKMSRHERVQYNGMMRDHHTSLAHQASQYAASSSEPDKWHAIAATHHHKAGTHATVLARLKTKRVAFGEEAEQIDERRSGPGRFDGEDDRGDAKSSRAQKIALDKKRKQREIDEEAAQLAERRASERMDGEDDHLDHKKDRAQKRLRDLMKRRRGKDSDED